MTRRESELESRLADAEALLDWAKGAIRHPSALADAIATFLSSARPAAPARTESEQATPYGTEDETPGFNAAKPLARRGLK